MRLSLRRLTLALGLVSLACLGLAGCQKDAEFSKAEMNQIKNPPKEMPPATREIMGKMGKGGDTSTPPRPAGQPGPGSPLGGK